MPATVIYYQKYAKKASIKKYIFIFTFKVSFFWESCYYICNGNMVSVHWLPPRGVLCAFCMKTRNSGARNRALCDFCAYVTGHGVNSNIRLVYWRFFENGTHRCISCARETALSNRKIRKEWYCYERFFYEYSYGKYCH